MKRAMGAVIVSAMAFLLTGCGQFITEIPTPDMPPAGKDYYRQLPPGAPALRRITDPALIPDFRPGFQADRTALLAALDHSIKWFNSPSSERHYPLPNLAEITHARAARSLAEFRTVLTTATSADEFQSRAVGMFDVYESVGCDNQGTVLFTGYYTPIFDGRLQADSEFKYPLYKLPADLVKDPRGEGECLGRRLPDGSLVPYYTRGEIDAGALKGQELVWLRDRFEAYICTVQGSAKLRLADGTVYNVAYAGNNGKDYTSVGRQLLDEQRIKPGELSLGGLIAFFRANPALMDEYLPRNERYVFFQPTATEPHGSIGVPVTARASLATDKKIFPRGCLTFVTTLVPQLSGGKTVPAEFRQFALDQDAGGGIRAPGRSDLYLGVGDDAGRLAGATMNEGRLYYLFLKDSVFSALPPPLPPPAPATPKPAIPPK